MGMSHDAGSRQRVASSGSGVEREARLRLLERLRIMIETGKIGD